VRVRQRQEIQILLQAMSEQPKVGDVLEATNPTALARRVLVTEVSATHFKASVLEGQNTREPITVFKAGWWLYAKAANAALSESGGDKPTT
jgi:hypothetical protein